MIYPLRFLIVGQSHHNDPLLRLVNPIIIHDNPYKSIRIHHNPSNSIVILLFPIVIQQLLKTSRRQWGMTRIFSASPVHVEHPHSMLPTMWKFPTHSLLNHGFWRGWKKIGRGFLVSGILRRSTVPPLCAPSAASFLGSAPSFFFRRADFSAGRGGHTRFVGHQPETRVDVGDLQWFTWYPLALVKIWEDQIEQDMQKDSTRLNLGDSLFYSVAWSALSFVVLSRRFGGCNCWESGSL